jgi:ubiquinone/menaquinone biosynthesis C-methylase UbiE
MHNRARLVAAAGVLILFASLTPLAQQAASSGVHPVSGRRYAPVMGYQGAEWLDRAERVSEEEPDIALDVLKIAKGSVAADVGAGSGYMTVKLAARVGPTGKVYANDIQPEMLTMLRERLSRMKITNVETVLGTTTDPRLPANSLDLILMVDVYHELQQPQVMLQHMRQALKPGGRLVLLEYRKEDPSIPIKFEHKMSVTEARVELEAEGYTLTKVDETLPRQHILIFTRP